MMPRPPLASVPLLLLVAALTCSAEDDAGLPPEESAARLSTPDDLRVDLMLAEPVIAQPVFCTFDERGRLWVVEYRQYPAPAGLEVVSRDNYWRAIYDRTPPAPPHHIPGEDRISIHEDTNGDGTLDRHSVFVDGLNIVTAVAHGRGGVWVLNPPYLLFYPDLDRDDHPDADPEVHLAGFHLEDTHSVVNSLTWGPDGWLYAAQGSTVSADVVRPGRPDAPVHSMGQLIWRYHSETRRYEIFSEGGGNAFGVEIDAAGHLFSGHNGGDTRGFHYLQGAYLQKGFSKHGPLSNPHAYGYFPWMKHQRVQRFAHCFVIYEEDLLPDRYQGVLFGAAPLLRHVVMSRISRDGSTFQTEDIGHAIESSDPWFRPVAITTGPDGAIWVCDWYDRQVAHTSNQEGQIDKSNGRIYRLSAKSATSSTASFDLATESSTTLVERLGDPRRWMRGAARRVLADRKDRSVLPLLRDRMERGRGQLALEALWAIHGIGGLDEAILLIALAHGDADVRRWAVRLAGDDGAPADDVAERILRLAWEEPDLDVRAQLASSAKRFPARLGLHIASELLRRDEDTSDPRLPLLIWWAIEARAEDATDEVLALFADEELWRHAIVAQHTAERAMRRFASTGRREDLVVCAKLFESAPDAEAAKALRRGFDAAFEGKTVPTFPPRLTAALARHGGDDFELRLRQGDAEAAERAVRTIVEGTGDEEQRLRLVRILGDVRAPAAESVLIRLATAPDASPIRSAALDALRRYDSATIGDALAAALPTFGPTELRSASSALASRAAWSKSLLRAVERGDVDIGDLAPSTLRLIRRHDDAELTELLTRWVPTDLERSAAETEAEIARVSAVADAGNGSPYAGKKLFRERCARCHSLFAEGGDIGPDLTSYSRADLRRMVESVVDPSAEIREGFEAQVAVTRSGAAYTGFLADQDDQVIILRGDDGQNVVLERGDVTALEPAGASLMPQGLLTDLDEAAIRDLFAYLRSTQPLNDGS